MKMSRNPSPNGTPDDSIRPTDEEIQAAFNQAVEQSPSELGESRVYVSRRDQGDPTTLDFVGHAGDDTFMIHWYIPHTVTDPDRPVIPDDGSIGDLSETTAEIGTKTATQPVTTESELGDRVRTAAREIRAAIADTPYPTHNIDPFYVVHIHGPDDTEEDTDDYPIYALLSAVTIA